MEVLDDMDEIEAGLDEMAKGVKYKARHRMRWSIVDVLVKQHSGGDRSIEACINRGSWTPANPEFEEFRIIHDPDELVAIARLALQAWEEMVRLKEANQNPEQQDKQV